MPQAHRVPQAQEVSDELDYQSLLKSAKTCKACELYQFGKQTVFGEGELHRPLMLVGEQPGDQEDKQGHPFVGPAGALLDKILQEVGIHRSHLYVTNAVKHFYHQVSRGRRLHKKPKVSHIRACRFWLEWECRLVQPRILVCLGATAAFSVWGHAVKVNEARGHFAASPLCELTWVTTHPSALLRIPDSADREAAKRDWAKDFGKIAEKMKS